MICNRRLKKAELIRLIENCSNLNIVWRYYNEDVAEQILCIALHTLYTYNSVKYARILENAGKRKPYFDMFGTVLTLIWKSI